MVCDEPIDLKLSWRNIPITLIMALRWALECNGLFSSTGKLSLNLIVDCQRIHDLFASLPSSIPIGLRALKNEQI